MSAIADPTGALSVLVPVYNEEVTVDEILTRVLALGSVVREIVVVDDGSTDRTAEIIRGRAAAEPKIRFFQADKNRGKTAAIAKALELAEGDVIIIQDADLEYDPAEIPDVIGPILSGVADVAYGSRFLVRKATRVSVLLPLPREHGSNILLQYVDESKHDRHRDVLQGVPQGGHQTPEADEQGVRHGGRNHRPGLQDQARTYEVPISYYGRS